jgi:hypothetical protein
MHYEATWIHSLSPESKDEWGEGIGDIQGPLVNSQRGAEDLKRDLYLRSRYDLERFALSVDLPLKVFEQQFAS